MKENDQKTIETIVHALSEFPESNNLTELNASQPDTELVKTLLGLIIQRMESTKETPESGNEALKTVHDKIRTVCHDLNQPLMAASGYTELILLDLPEDSSIRDKMLTIKSSIDKLIDFVPKLLNITNS
jgi:signal transduction histidine kinase